jgi:cell shape-determining protein MreD
MYHLAACLVGVGFIFGLIAQVSETHPIGVLGVMFGIAGVLIMISDRHEKT